MATLAAAPATGTASTPASVPAVDQHGPTILETYRKLFFIGTAADLPGGFSDLELNLVKENFNIVTPGKLHEARTLPPRRRTSGPSTSLTPSSKWCTDNKVAIHGHTLVWKSQTNAWFFEGGDKATITKRMKDHITTLVGRYKGKIRGWDVVNEAINDGGKRPKPPRPRTFARTAGWKRSVRNT